MSAAPKPESPKVMLAHLRHDLRTPVNAIIGYSEMLLEDDDASTPSDFHALLERLPALGKQLLGLINDLLEASKIENLGNRLNLETLLADLRRQLHAPAAEVFHNADTLIGKAGQASRSDAVADLEKIREAGRRLLALLDQMTVLGRVAAAAPSPPPAAAAGRRDADIPRRAAETLIRGHLLIIEDNDFNRDLLGRAVTRQGHTFADVPGGRQGLEALRSSSFDLVLLDVTMPEMNGLEVLQTIKCDARLKHIPVIMISALDEIETVVRCIEMGAEDYLPKPFDPVLLKARVDACLEKKRLRDQELDYLRNVAAITGAVSSLDAGAFDPESLHEVAARTDALGKLAQMFQHMAQEVQAREQRLRQEVQALRVEIDEAKKAKQVAEVTETGYFQDLQQKVQELRKRKGR
jgi:DNA-binding response OmpR family regulator